MKLDRHQLERYGTGELFNSIHAAIDAAPNPPDLWRVVDANMDRWRRDISYEIAVREATLSRVSVTSQFVWSIVPIGHPEVLGYIMVQVARLIQEQQSRDNTRDAEGDGAVAPASVR